MDTAKSLNDLSKVYLESVYSNEESVDEAAYPGYDEKGNPLKKEPKDNRHVVTYADKKANTPAYQKFKAGNKNYKKADHLNNEEFIYRLEESGKFSVEEIQTILEAEVNELYKGKHGQSEKEYQAGRSDAGKRISGDEKHGPASYTRRGVVDQKPTKPGEKPEHTPKLGSAEKSELDYRKSRLKKANEEVVNEEGADRLKDRRMERGGVDGNVRYDKPNRNPETKTSVTQKKDSMLAFDKVASDLKKKYGDKAVTTSKKTVKKEEIDIRKISEGKCEDCDCKGCGDDGVRHQNPCVECGGHHKEEKEVDEAMVKLKGKKKGNVIINPEVSKVNEGVVDFVKKGVKKGLERDKKAKKEKAIKDRKAVPYVALSAEHQPEGEVIESADVAKKQQIQRKQLMINKQKLALQQRATTKKKPTDMHMEETEDIQEVDVTTRSVDYGQEIENTALKRKKQKKSLSDFKKLSKPKNLDVK